MKFEDLKGKTITSITITDDKECMTFTMQDGDSYRLIYYQDCCASCEIEDICGELDDLIGNPLLVAEEVIHCNSTPDGISLPNWIEETYTWTFYKLDTIKGGVTIRWYGTSNGYYSEEVTFEKVL